MSRITKEIAHATAVSLLSKKKETLNGLKLRLKALVTEAVKKTIPKEVLQLFETQKHYLNTHSNTRLYGEGFGYEYYQFDQLPDDGNDPKVCVADGNKILALSNKIEKSEEEYKKLLKEIEIALFAFRTYANVEKEFPEAFALLPTKVSQAVMVNISSIRTQIAS
ncbi:MAG: hypothetical protein EOO20_07115 [Chryseobacterium sp.]|nr:MAG: hypothetical protein EOO20_07115 [Chryseobacterium sp.]